LKYEIFCSHASKDTWGLGARSKAVMRAAGKTETMQENIQDWLSWMKETLISVFDK
jgi:hypothetical protein